MGNNIYYLNREIELSDISKDRWKVARRMLDVLVDYLNSAMQNDWSAGEFRNVGGGGETKEFMNQNALSSQSPPSIGKFRLENILEDLSDNLDEIIFINAAELKRLYQWCDFLKERDGAFEFFVPLVNTLRQKTANIDSRNEEA